MEKALERQRRINGLLSDVALQTARIEHYISTVQSYINLGTMAPGSGPMAVQARLDTLHADYSDAKMGEAQLERLQQDATKLQEEGRGDDVQAASKNIGVK